MSPGNSFHHLDLTPVGHLCHIYTFGAGVSMVSGCDLMIFVCVKAESVDGCVVVVCCAAGTS